MSRHHREPQFVLLPIVQIRPTGLLFYTYCQWLNGRPKPKSLNNWLVPSPADASPTAKLTGTATYGGEMTAHSIRRLKRAIQLLIAISQVKRVKHFKNDNWFDFRVNFITLTLPAPQGEISDRTIMKTALEPWIRTMRRKHNLKHYIWKAERQKNGSIHYHFTTDCYIPYYNIRDSWNHHLAPTGLVKAFAKKHGHYKPNSTDVHSIQSIENLAGYMIKYMCKESEGLEPIEGKMWDCSKSLKTKHRCEIVLDSVEAAAYNHIKQQWPDHIIKDEPDQANPGKVIRPFEFVWFTEQQLKVALPPAWQSDYQAWLSSVRNA